MKTKKLTIKLTKNQLAIITKFLLSHGIKQDGKTQFGLLGEPKVMKKDLVIRLLSISETQRIDTLFEKMGLYEDEIK